VKYSPVEVRRFAESLQANAQIQNIPIDLLEKDIWITYILRELRSLDESNHLAFKGGTCLVKAYFGYYRFSEDIDFTWFGPKIDRRKFRNRVLGATIDALALEWDRQVSQGTGIAGSHSGGIFSYFLLSPSRDSTSVKLKITVAFDEKLAFTPLLRKLGHVPIGNEIKRYLTLTFGDIAAGYFDVNELWCYTPKEIACEKVRALLTRRTQPARSRDLMDLYNIASGKNLEKAAPPDEVRSKLASALKIRAYKSEYARITQNIETHLEQLVAESATDPVFLTKVDSKNLDDFARRLNEYLENEILAKARR